MTADELLARLEGVRKSTSGPRRWMAKCPAHSDSSASLSIRETDDGRVLINCFGGCEAGAVTSAVGITLRDLFPLGSATAAHGRRAPPSFREMVDALEIDVMMLFVAAATMAKGEQLSTPARNRLRESAARILRGLEECRRG